MIGRDETIINYMGYAAGIALKMQRGGADESESVAFEALIKAVDDYDESKGNISLTTYIYHKVEFALLSYFRELFGRPTVYTGKVARENQELMKNFCYPGDIDDYQNALAISLNGTEKKVCDKDMILKIMTYIKGIKYSSFGANRKGDTTEIFRLYFVEDLPMCAVAKKQNITESRVSQIIQETIVRCKKHFRQEDTA